MSLKSLVLVSVSLGMGLLPCGAGSTAGKVAQDLRASLAGNTALTPEARKAAEAALAPAHPKATDISKALRILHPDFDAQLKGLMQGDQKAVKALESMATGNDPFLASEAAYNLGRTYLGAENYVAAARHLSRINTAYARHSARVGESLYYQGLSEAGALRNEDAVDSLLTMIAFHKSEVPDSLVDTAKKEVARLEDQPVGDLRDVARHMSYAESKLALADAREDTCQVQGRIVDMLDELIKIAEQPPN